MIHHFGEGLGLARGRGGHQREAVSLIESVVIQFSVQVARSRAVASFEAGEISRLTINATAVA